MLPLFLFVLTYKTQVSSLPEEADLHASASAQQTFCLITENVHCADCSTWVPIRMHRLSAYTMHLQTDMAVCHCCHLTHKHALFNSPKDKDAQICLDTICILFISEEILMSEAKIKWLVSYHVPVPHSFKALKSHWVSSRSWKRDFDSSSSGLVRKCKG